MVAISNWNRNFSTGDIQTSSTPGSGLSNIGSALTELKRVNADISLMSQITDTSLSNPNSNTEKLAETAKRYAPWLEEKTKILFNALQSSSKQNLDLLEISSNASQHSLKALSNA
jgi:hypothetical protein